MAINYILSAPDLVIVEEKKDWKLLSHAYSTFNSFIIFPICKLG